MQVTLDEIPQVLSALKLRIDTTDAKAVQKMQAIKLNPKVCRSKTAIAFVTNQARSRSKQFGGDTRARLKAKLQANLC